MRVEHVHEHADLQRIAVEVGVAAFFHRDDAAVGGRDHGVGIVRNVARRVAEELQDEKRHQPERNRPPSPQVPDDQRSDDCRGEERPAFPGDDGVGIRGHGLGIGDWGLRNC